MSDAKTTLQVDLPITPGVLEAFASSLLQQWFSLSNEKLLTSIDRQAAIATSYVLPDLLNKKAVTAVLKALEHNKIADKWLADNAALVDAEIERAVGIHLRAEIDCLVERAVFKAVNMRLLTLPHETRRNLDDAVANAIASLSSLASEPSDV
jgi:hypothetical protein